MFETDRAARWIRPLLTLLAITTTSPVLAADERLKVGLVLGGGGARGAAHIGVLQELERLQVPVDAVVGTSMGAIVGGLYASGMSTAELEELVTTLDWAAALSDRPDRSDLSFRRKQDDADFPIDLELGLADGDLKIPQGAIKGQKLDLLLRQLTLHVPADRHFDELEIPFRAIASNLVDGEAYILEQGDLARAIRASMSVPGAFAPVAIDDALLVDGGLVGNLGVSVMKEMDVDVIIAVDVEFPLYELAELSSALAISEQVLTIMIRNATLRQIDLMDDDDILIRPELGTFASTAFARSVETLQPGIEATAAVKDRLAAVRLGKPAYDDYQRNRRQTQRVEEELAFVRVVDQDGKVQEDLLRHIEPRPGDTVNADSLGKAANRLFGLRAFEQVSYSLLDESGRTGVEFRTSEKTWGKTFLKFGLSIEDDFEGSTAVNFTTRFWQPEVNRLGAELRTDIRVGTQPLLATEFYQPVSYDSRFFVAPRIDLSQRNIDTFVADQAVARLRVSEALAGVDIGAALGNWGEFRLGAYSGGGNARVKVGDPAIENLSFDRGGAFAKLSFDTFDDAHFPHRGVRGEVRWDAALRGLGADNRFNVLTVDLNSAWTRGKSTLVAGFDFATSERAESVLQSYFPVGGFLRLSGLAQGQLSGPHAGVARLVYYRRIGESAGGLVDVPLYAGASLEAGNVWARRDDISADSLIGNGSLFLGVDTFVGPVFLAAGFSEGGESNFYLFLGGLPD